MKRTKTIFKILILLFLAQNSFAASKPVPSIGIVVKKNPGQTQAKIVTGKDGSFSSQLEAGEYEISFSQDQLRSVINKIVKMDYLGSTYEYDGSSVELALDNSGIRVNLKPIKEKIYAINALNSTFVIVVPEGGATFSGVLSWNDDVLKNSATDNRGIDKVDVRRTNNPYFKNSANQGEMVPMNRSVKANTTGVLRITSDEKRLKGIKENGLKKDDADINTTSSEKKGLNAVNVKLSKETSTEVPNTIDDPNKGLQDHAVRTKGSGATTGPEVKPIKVEEIKIGQPHP